MRNALFARLRHGAPALGRRACQGWQVEIVLQWLHQRIAVLLLSVDQSLATSITGYEWSPRRGDSRQFQARPSIEEAHLNDRMALSLLAEIMGWPEDDQTVATHEYAWLRMMSAVKYDG